MTRPFDWMKRVFQGGKTGLQLISPSFVEKQNPLVRVALGGGTVLAIVSLGLLGATAFAALLFAIGAIYFLATEVLGLKVNLDPSALYQTMWQTMQRSGGTAYGAN